MVAAGCSDHWHTVAVGGRSRGVYSIVLIKWHTQMCQKCGLASRLLPAFQCCTLKSWEEPGDKATKNVNIPKMAHTNKLTSHDN